jgi:3-isopropylmalate dehydratase small subunit
VHILHLMGVAGIASVAFGRQFFRNCINNGLPVVECDLAGVADGDEIEIDLSAGRVAVPQRGIVREVPPLPPEVQQILAAGGLIPFLKAHPDWKTA